MNSRTSHSRAGSRAEAVERLVEVFFEHGFDGASLKRIEGATGLGRASLYHYFPGGKSEMAWAVLEATDLWAAERLRKVALDADRPAENRLREMLGSLDAVHAQAAQLSPSNAVGIGEARADFGGHVAGHYHGLVELMSGLMEACGLPREVALRRAWEFRVVWEGGLVCARVLDDMSLFRALMKQMPARMLAPADEPGLLPDKARLPRRKRKAG